ncbi:hypothetical protein OW763_12995 [Clostridium aestuarii]|uniref:Uncharacterized protein n=1 Tax=Clostridium aestuarii TaxID=338193 RepID=A0ABT4D3N5_9CLOT|nr:hypothetical protein [Clostridium aestuarii]MCY6485257.1 hypothetical protein [Clostridium aestuarii]
MFSLVREGPKILLIESKKIDELVLYVKQKFDAKECNFNFAYENSEEDYTILCLTDKLQEVVKEKHIKHIFLIKYQPDKLFCDVLNDNKINLISGSRLAPRIIVMRAFGDFEKIIDEIQKDYMGNNGKLHSILNEHNNKGNIILFSKKPLSNKISLLDIYEKAIYVEQEYYYLLKSLRKHGLRYLNQGLGERDWYDLDIKIYDRFEAYKLQYDKLIRVIDNLELGVVMGESWGIDSPRFLMKVEIYRLRLFTLLEPEYIKKILLALEYSEAGTRIVDYDLYYNRRKIGWTDIEQGEIKARNLLGQKYRNLVFSKISSKESLKILDIENKILQTRK